MFLRTVLRICQLPTGGQKGFYALCPLCLSIGRRKEPPLCKWEKICKQIGTACRDGGIVKSDNLHKTIPQSASLTAPFTQAFDTRSFYAEFLFAFCSSAKPLWNPAAMAGFSAYKEDRERKTLSVFFISATCRFL